MNEGQGQTDRMGSRSRGWMERVQREEQWGRMGTVDEWKPEGVVTRSAGNETGAISQ